MEPVVFVHQDGVPSGSAISLQLMVANLNRRRYAPRILLARDGPARASLQSLGVEVDVVPAHGFWTSPSLPFYMPDYYRNFKALIPNRALVAYLRSAKPALVHINDKAMLGAGLAAKRVGVPVVWHLRSAYAGGRSRLLNAVSRAVICRTAAHAIAISEDEVEGFDQSIPVSIVRNSVDLTKAEDALARRAETRTAMGLAEHDVAVCMVGRLTGTKGAWDFIEAAGMVRRQFPSVPLRFVVVAPVPGREPLNWGMRGKLGLVDKTHPEDRLWSLARATGVDAQLTIADAEADVLRVLAAMDVVSACYRLWAIGRPAIEAMAVGRPVVVNEGHSGRSGVVRHMETGFVVERANPKALADAVGTLVAEPALRARLGAAGRLTARRDFDAIRNTAAVESIYGRVLSERSGSTRAAPVQVA